MKKNNLNEWLQAKKVLELGGIGVLPTDTLYGLVGRAMSKRAVGKIYRVKYRNEAKPLIVLIHSYADLNIFGIKIDESIKKELKEFWPGKVSVILPCSLKKFEYIHRGTNSIAFRMIGLKNKNLFNLIKKVGPIVAPSANPEGLPPALTIPQAKKYFYLVKDREGSQRTPSSNRVDDEVDFYIDAGTKKSKPSTLIRIKKGKIEILRK